MSSSPTSTLEPSGNEPNTGLAMAFFPSAMYWTSSRPSTPSPRRTVRTLPGLTRSSFLISMTANCPSGFHSMTTALSSAFLMN